MVDNPLFPDLEYAIERPIVISSAGSIASGKSTFLSVLHEVLRYSGRIKLEKDILPRGGGQEGKEKRVAKAVEKQKRGMFRTNSTFKSDSMFVYLTNGNCIYPFEFFAPGGHAYAQKIANVDGLLYFIDLNLAKMLAERDGMYRIGNNCIPLAVGDRSVVKAIERSIGVLLMTNRSGYFYDIQEEAGAPEDCRSVEDLATFLAKSYQEIPKFGLPLKKGESYEDRRRFKLYKNREFLGAVVQSIIDSYKYAVSEFANGVPIVGIGTHLNEVYGKLPKDQASLLASVEDNFNMGIMQYTEYKRILGMEAEEFALDLGSGLPIQWYFTDLCRKISQYKGDDPAKKELYRNKFWEVPNHKNKDVLAIAYNIMAKALQNMGIDPIGFKIITFSDAKSDFTVRYS